MTRSTLFAHLLKFGVAILRATLRIELLHGRKYSDLLARRVPILLALWHGRMFLPIDAHRHAGIVTMASKSGDGELIARWLEHNGYFVTRGSTTRGGSEALRHMVRRVRSGHNAALTVDGPQGPARVVQPGVVRLAQLTEAWILPISFSSSRPMLLSSWDRFLVPKPFSRNFVAYGDPFPISKEMSDEAALTKVRVALDEATEEADRAAGIRLPL